MSRSTPDATGGLPELDPRLHSAVDAINYNVWQNIRCLSGNTRSSLGRVFNQQRKEYVRQSDEDPRRQSRGEAKTRAIRGSMTDVELKNNTRNNFIAPVSFKWPGGANTFVFTPRPGLRNNLPRTEAELATLLQGKSEAILATLGIDVTHEGTVTWPTTNLTAPDAAAIAHGLWSKLEEKKNSLRTALQAGGTTEGNIQVALQLAGSMPEEIDSILDSGVSKHEAEVKKIKDLKHVLTITAELQAVPTEAYRVKFSEVVAERTDINDDIAEILTGTATAYTLKSKAGKELIKSTPLNISTLSPGRKDHYEELLREELKKIDKAEKHYQNIENILMRLRAAFDAAGVVPTDLQAMFTGTPPLVDRTKVDSKFDAKSLTEKLTKAADLKTREQYDADQKTAETALEAAHHKALSGEEIIKAIYLKHFEKTHPGIPPDQAKRAAHELYGRNVLTGTDRQKIKSELEEKRDVLKHEKLTTLGYIGKELRELAVGSEEEYIKNLVSSPAIMGKEGKKGMRRFGFLYLKSGARPQWGRFDPDQLAVSYFAIRDSVRLGKLKNSPYVRKQLGELSQLVMYNTERAGAREEGYTMTAEQKQAVLAGRSEREVLSDSIPSFLKGDVPSQYVGRVSDAIAHATRKTAHVRRWAGRTTKTVVLSPFRLVGRVFGFGGRKAKGGIKGVWNHLWEKRTLSQALKGEKGGAHHHHDTHAAPQANVVADHEPGTHPGGGHGHPAH